MQNEIKLSEFKEVFNYLLENNKRLVDLGQTPISIGLEGEAGIGKTQIVKQIAEEKGMTIATINLAELEEIGDLTGFPMKEIYCTTKDKDGKTIGKWFPENIASSLPIHITKTNKVRMSYAPPAWLPTEMNPCGTILYVDDFSRASNLFMQAIMTLICEGTYISWSLPKYTTVVLSSNPDNGQYNVTGLDDAMLTRFCNFHVKFDLDDWAKWAEAHDIEGKAINFALLYGDEIFKKHNNVQVANARSFTNLCKAIGGIKDWENPDNLELIMQICKGCFLRDNDNIIGNLFTAFIANKLDKLIQPKEMLELEWNKLEPKMMNCVYTNGTYRPEIASVLTIRFVNYISNLFEQKGAIKESVVNDRLIEFVDAKQILISEDLFFYTLKTLITKYPNRTGKLLLNPKIRSKVTC